MDTCFVCGKAIADRTNDCVTTVMKGAGAAKIGVTQGSTVRRHKRCGPSTKQWVALFGPSENNQLMQRDKKSITKRVPKDVSWLQFLGRVKYNLFMDTTRVGNAIGWVVNYGHHINVAKVEGGTIISVMVGGTKLRAVNPSLVLGYLMEVKEQDNGKA